MSSKALKLFLFVSVLTLAVTTLPRVAAEAAYLRSWASGSISDTSVSYGDRVWFTGTVGPDGASDRVAALYRINDDGSRNFIRKRSVDSRGDYRVPVPTDRIGATRYVIDIPATDRYRGASTEPEELNVSRVHSRISSYWSRLHTTLNRRAVVSGRVTGTAGHRRRVEAQMWIPGGWERVAAGWTDRAGRYTLRLSTTWYHRKTIRVVARATSGATRVVSGYVRQSVTPSYNPRGRSSDWAPLSERTRMRWNPCRSITWRFNSDNAPRGALADVREAVRRVREASGISFRYLGKSRVIPGTSRGWPADAELVIAYARPWQSKWDLRGNIVGQAGPTRLVSGRDAAGEVWKIVRGGVVMDASARLRGGFGVGDTRGRVLMHEIGHVIGLGHARRSNQMLYGVANSTIPARWGEGDLAGMRQLGLSRGCVSDDSSRARGGGQIEMPAPPPVADRHEEH